VIRNQSIQIVLVCFLFTGNLAAQNPKPRSQAEIPVSFTDITRAAGIDFHLTCGSAEKRYIMDSMCGGVAVFDYDNDGWIDIFLVNGSTLQDMQSGKCHTSKLYRNNHDGTFKDVTTQAGLNTCRWGFGVAVGDYDNDGFEDVYITYLDGGALYRNNGNGTFTDVTQKAGAGNQGRWGTSAAFGDHDNDGHLDLFIANYVTLDLKNLPQFGEGPFCQYRGIAVSCGPRGLQGARDRLYHNNGDGTFTDVTEKLTIDPNSYYGLGVLWLDYDRDGCLDLYVANDSSPSLLYHNDCKGGFTEVGTEAGTSYSADGKEQAGMGIDSADYDNDGWPDIVKTNFSDDSNNLYHNDHNGEFTDLAGAANFGPISIPFLAFGIKFLDFDNDGWQDIFVANGHVNPQVDQHALGITYAERPFLFHNLQDGKFEEIGEQVRTGTAAVRISSTVEAGIIARPPEDLPSHAAKQRENTAQGTSPGSGLETEEPHGGERLVLTRTPQPGSGNQSPQVGQETTESRRGGQHPNPFSHRYVARGAATADFFNRGTEDLLVTVLNGSALLLRNDSQRGHWLRLKLVGTTSNRDGFGARVEIKAGTLTQTAEARANSSFESASDPRLHFGLGSATKVDSITVHWPSGKVDTIAQQSADQQLEIKEGLVQSKPSK
jgi:enediyne biosynthesis protein E4